MTIVQRGLSISDPNAYRGNLFTLLGDRDPLDVIERTASTLAGVVTRTLRPCCAPGPLQTGGPRMKSSAIWLMANGCRVIG